MRDDRMMLHAAGLFSLLVVAMTPPRVSASALSDASENAGGRWTAGDVVLTYDDSDMAMIAVTNVKPGHTEIECITATYSGSPDAAVTPYGSLTAGDGLDDCVNVTVRTSRRTGVSLGFPGLRSRHPLD